MASNSRAPKQWSLTKHETITSFEAWRQNLQYSLSLDPNFALFLLDGIVWTKKSPTTPLRGFTSDADDVPAPRRTSQQKVTQLELMLGQIANYCPIISRNTIVRNSTSINSIWQAIRLHYGFQSTGAHFLDFNAIHLTPDERPEDLYQRLVSFMEDNLLTTNGSITHHGIPYDYDEEMSPSLENLIVLTWLRLIHHDLPILVKQRYGTELRSRTLASIKPEISQALDSLLEEVQTAADAKVLRSTTKDIQRRYTRFPDRKIKSCPICKQSGRQQSDHFLSACPFLPAEDRSFMLKARLISPSLDEEVTEDVNYTVPSAIATTATVHTNRVSTNQSPYLNVFYCRHHLKLTIDTGAETNLIKASLAHYIGAPIQRSTQKAVQADGKTPLTVVGEIHITLVRQGINLQLDALVVEDLDVDVLAGTPFMSRNDISVRPAKDEITIQGINVAHYGSSDSPPDIHMVRRTHAYKLCAPPISTVALPEECLKPNIPIELNTEDTLATEGLFDSPCARNSKDFESWSQPSIISTVADKLHLVNDTTLLSKCDTVLPIKPLLPINPDVSIVPTSDKPLSKVDSLHDHNHVFNKHTALYNGLNGPFEDVVNVGPVQPTELPCTTDNCQIHLCSCIALTEDSVFRALSVQDKTSDVHSLPFTTRSAWIQTQAECPDLRRVHSHLKHETRPPRKITDVWDVKRYLNTVTIAKDGLLVVQQTQALDLPRELIVVPKEVLDKLLLALHLKLSHPTKHQLKQVVKRYFFALDIDRNLGNVSSSCHMCASVHKLPSTPMELSSEVPPGVIGVSFTAGVLKRCEQLILVLRETDSSYTTACFIDNEQPSTLRDGLIRLLLELRPLDGPPALIRVDPASGFVGLQNDDVLNQLHFCVEVERVKNVNKNPGAEKAIAKLKDELLKQEPCAGPISQLCLALSIVRLNSSIRIHGLSTREIWTHRNKYSKHSDLTSEQQDYPLYKHSYSENNENHAADIPSIQVGDIVYIRSDPNKTYLGDRYLVIEVMDPWCFIRKFSGSRLRSMSYKVKHNECNKVPSYKSLDIPLGNKRYTCTDTFSNENTTTAFDSYPTEPSVLTLPMDQPPGCD